MFSRCCSLMIGGVILLSACKGGGNQSQNNSKDTVASNKVKDTISPRIEQFTKRIATNPKDADAYWKRGILEAAQKKFNLALTDYSIAIRIDSAKADYYYSFADAEFLTGKTHEAQEAFEKCISLDPKNTAALLKLGEFFLYLKKYDDAIDMINRALKIDPYQAKAYFMKGIIYLEHQDTAKAISSMQTAVEQNPKYFNAYIQLGLLFSKKHNPAAITYFNNAINAEPNNVEAYYDIGMFYQNMQDYDNAIKAYQNLLQVDSTYKFALYCLGTVYYIGKQDYKQSLAYYSRAIRSDSAYSLAYYGRGNCYEQLGQNDKAMNDFNAALHFNPGFVPASDAMKELQAKMHK